MKPKDFFNKQTTYSGEAEARAANEHAKKLSELEDQQRLDAVNEEIERQRNEKKEKKLQAEIKRINDRQDKIEAERAKQQKIYAEQRKKDAEQRKAQEVKTLDAALPLMMNTPGVIDLIRSRNGKLPSPSDFRQNSPIRLNHSMSHTRRNDSPPRTIGGRVRSNRVRRSIRATCTRSGTRTRSRTRTRRGTRTRSGRTHRGTRSRRVVRKQ